MADQKARQDTEAPRCSWWPFSRKSKRGHPGSSPFAHEPPACQSFAKSGNNSPSSAPPTTGQPTGSCDPENQSSSYPVGAVPDSAPVDEETAPEEARPSPDKRKSTNRRSSAASGSTSPDAGQGLQLATIDGSTGNDSPRTRSPEHGSVERQGPEIEGGSAPPPSLAQHHNHDEQPLYLRIADAVPTQAVSLIGSAVVLALFAKSIESCSVPVKLVYCFSIGIAFITGFFLWSMHASYAPSERQRKILVSLYRVGTVAIIVDILLIFSVVLPAQGFVVVCAALGVTALVVAIMIVYCMRSSDTRYGHVPNPTSSDLESRHLTTSLLEFPPAPYDPRLDDRNRLVRSIRNFTTRVGCYLRTVFSPPGQQQRPRD